MPDLDLTRKSTAIQPDTPAPVLTWRTKCYLIVPIFFMDRNNAREINYYPDLMEVDESSVLTSTPSSVSVSLHPLVVMNISDHFTRVRMQQEDPATPPKGEYSKSSTPPDHTGCDL